MQTIRLSAMHLNPHPFL